MHALDAEAFAACMLNFLLCHACIVSMFCKNLQRACLLGLHQACSVDSSAVWGANYFGLPSCQICPSAPTQAIDIPCFEPCKPCAPSQDARLPQLVQGLPCAHEWLVSQTPACLLTPESHLRV